jgi:hypothetical protein
MVLLGFSPAQTSGNGGSYSGHSSNSHLLYLQMPKPSSSTSTNGGTCRDAACHTLRRACCYGAAAILFRSIPAMIL